MFGLARCLLALAVSSVLADWDEVAVRLSERVDLLHFAEAHGLAYLGRIANLSNYHLFRKRTDHNPSTHTHPADCEDSEWVQPQTRRQLDRRGQLHDDFNDPQYGAQWHWHDAEVGLELPGAWQRGYTGAGVTISILDDGLDYQHPDLVHGYSHELSYDINGQRKVPELQHADVHGTMAAGLAAGRGNNGVCGLGASHRARIAAVRLVSRATTDAEEAQGISYGAPEVDVYSASWGPVDDGRRLEGPGHLALEALEAVVNGHRLHPHLHGRNGKGAIYVWAAGNGRAAGDNCNYDGWANSRLTVTIAAMTDSAQPTLYSESCSALLATAPSSGGRRAITTSDIRGRAGQSSGDCVRGFSGTSAVAPMVAGIVGLMLQANPELGWRDVQHILVHSSTPVASDLGQLNTAGLYYSHRFGFGLINATAAVVAAERYAATRYTAAPADALEYCVQLDEPVPDGSSVEQTIQVPENRRLEHVEVRLSVEHPHRGELEVSLHGPTTGGRQTRSQLADQHRDPNPNYANWTLMTMAHWDELSAGEWTLTVGDAVHNGQVGRLNGWCLRLWTT